MKSLSDPKLNPAEPATSHSSEHAPQFSPPSDRTSAYVGAVVDDELSRLAWTTSGRSCETFRAAAALGNFVGAGLLDRSEAEQLLLETAVTIGLPQRRALSQIRRGLKRGEQTPRAVPDEHSRTGGTPRNLAIPPKPPSPPRRPPADEVEAVWAMSRPVSADSAVAAYLQHRLITRGAVELVETWDVARALPAGMRLPKWAGTSAASWSESGHRVLLRQWDHAGRFASLRARSIDPTAKLKSLAPHGYEVAGLVIADPLAVQLLGIGQPAWLDRSSVVVCEGEIDFLSWVARQSDAHAGELAYIGVVSGGWNAAIADRVPDGARVAVRTHHDAAGERYAAEMIRTLRGRCEVFRTRTQEVGL